MVVNSVLKGNCHGPRPCRLNSKLVQAAGMRALSNMFFKLISIPYIDYAHMHS